MAYRSVESTIRNVMSRIDERMLPPEQENDQNDQVSVGTYTTKAFEMCPEAQKLYADLPHDTDSVAAEVAAINLDRLFDLERDVLNKKMATQEQANRAEHLAAIVMHNADKMGPGMLEKHSFVKQHVEAVKKLVTDEGQHRQHIDPEDHLHPSDDPRFRGPPKRSQPDPMVNVQGAGDRDIDNIKRYLIRRSQKAQRKIKLIDTD